MFFKLLVYFAVLILIKAYSMGVVLFLQVSNSPSRVLYCESAAVYPVFCACSVAKQDCAADQGDTEGLQGQS